MKLKVHWVPKLPSLQTLFLLNQKCNKMTTQPEDKKIAVLLQHLAQTFTDIPFNQLIGLRLDQVTKDHAVMLFNMRQELIGNFLQGILHGGVISSVLDMAGGVIVMAS